MARRKIVVVHQKYPDIPPDATIDEIIEEHFLYSDENNYPRRVLVGKVYCPKKPVVSGTALFDPTTEIAQAALEKHKKRFENRRRYDRTIKKRRSKPTETTE